MKTSAPVSNCDRCMVIVGSFLGYFLAYGLPEGFRVMTHNLSVNSGTTIDVFVWISFLFYGLMLGTGLLSGILVYSIGCRSVAMIGCILMLTGMTASIFVENFIYLFITFGILGGLGAGLTVLPAIVIVMKHSDDHQSISLAVATCGVGVGTVVMPILTRLWMNEYGLESTFLFFAVLCTQGIISAFLYRRTQHKEPINHRTSWLKPTSVLSTGRVEKLLSRWRDTSFFIKKNIDNRKTLAAKNKKKKSFDSLGEIMPSLRNPLFVIFVVSGVLAYLVLLVPMIQLFYGAHGDIISPDMLKLTATVSIIAASLLIGQICDHADVDRMTVYIINMAVLGTVSILGPLATSQALFIPMALFLGGCFGVFTFLQPVILTDLLGIEALPLGLGIMMMFEGVAVSIGTPLTSWFTVYVEKEYAGAYLAGAVFIASSLVALVIPFKRKQHFVENTSSESDVEKEMSNIIAIS